MFNGFPSETPDFLFSLRLCNTVAKQQENTVQYKRLVSEPLRRLFDALVPTVMTLDSSLQTRPSVCISSPYTDRRFSPDTPLKEYMYLRFRRAGLKDNIAGLYFDMGSDYYSFGLRIYKQNAKGMDLLREKIFCRADEFEKALSELHASGFEIIGDCYKTDRFPHMTDGYAKNLCNRRGFYIGKNIPVNSNVFAPSFADEIADGFNLLGTLLKLI